MTEDHIDLIDLIVNAVNEVNQVTTSAAGGRAFGRRG
jgi:hypothetical protein